jgi:hypothetical protein
LFRWYVYLATTDKSIVNIRDFIFNLLIFRAKNQDICDSSREVYNVSMTKDLGTNEATMKDT